MLAAAVKSNYVLLLCQRDFVISDPGQWLTDRLSVCVWLAANRDGLVGFSSLSPGSTAQIMVARDFLPPLPSPCSPMSPPPCCGTPSPLPIYSWWTCPTCTDSQTVVTSANVVTSLTPSGCKARSWQWWINPYLAFLTAVLTVVMNLKLTVATTCNLTVHM